MTDNGTSDSDTPASLEAEGDVLRARGNWTVAHLREVEAKLSAASGVQAIDISGIHRLDTAGAWLLRRAAEDKIEGATETHQLLLEEVARHEPDPIPARRKTHAVMDAIARLGRAVAHAARSAVEMLSFSGLILMVIWDTVRGRRRLRLHSVVHNIETAGFDAVPIISLISFLVGAVICFLSADILKEYGGSIFAVDLIAVAFFREFGVLLAAIMVAGRSGSAYTAEIGAMKGHEEIDAMRTLALDPIEILVIPRLIALFISLPLLTFVADLMGLVGGAMVSWMILDLGPQSFINRLLEATGADNYFVGMIKAPFFAFLVAMIGCFQGFKVTGTAESVGEHTTRSVVESIFVVIVFDAVFAMFFQEIGY